MKRSSGILGILVVGTIAAWGCGKGPTDPGGGNGGGGPDQGLMDLSGSWTGTITDSVGTCATESIQVDLSQSLEDAHGFTGAKAVGSFSTPCEGSLTLSLYINKANNLTGNLQGKGHITGDASAKA